MKKKGSWTETPGIELIPALALFGAIVVLAGRYGFFRDEMYYLSCARRLDWGYVDQPPFSIALLAAVQAKSLFAVKLFAGFIGGLTVYLAGRAARAFGAGSFGAGVTSFGLLLAPMFVGTESYYSMNGIECLCWVSVTLAFVAALKGSKNAWLVFGLLLGVGLLNKYTMGLFAVTLFLGVLLAARSELKSRNVWLGALIAAILFAPHLVWEARNHWPTLEFMHNATVVKMASISPPDFFKELLLSLNPFVFLLLQIGLLWLVFSKAAKPVRPLGIALICALVLLSVSGKVRPSYALPACVVGLAAAGAACEAMFKGKVKWVLTPVFLGAAAVAAIALPMALPILSPQSLAAQIEKLGLAPHNDEKKDMGPLPQFMADRFGWQELANHVLAAYNTLPAGERDDARIVVQNYGEASAIENLAPELKDKVVCGHNNFFLWGAPDWSGGTAIVLGNAGEIAKFYTSVQKWGEWDHAYAMPYERHQSILVCRDGRAPASKILATIRTFN